MEHDKKAAKTNKQTLEPKRTAKDSEALRDDELNSATGGSTVSNVIKGFGEALSSAARKG